MIELRDIRVVFNKGTHLEQQSLKDINLKIEKGEFVTIIGGNGAGKSTLMDLLSGDIRPSSGQILIDDVDVTKLSTEKRAHLIARVFQIPILGTYASFTIEENMSIAYMRGINRGVERSISKKLRQKFRELLSGLGMNMEERIHSKVSSLSGGQRQALTLIMATMQKSKLLLLDEHTAALDPKMAESVLKLTTRLISASKITTLMVTHSMREALDYGDRTIVMQRGTIVKDLFGEARKKLSSDDLLKYFDLN